MTIQDLNTRKEILMTKVGELVRIKKQKYSNVDIESPMTEDEKELNNKIAKMYSDINIIIRQKRAIK